MRLGKGKKRLLVGFGLAFAALLFIWFSAPLWFPWLLGPLGNKNGLHFARYEREDYSHFVLHDAVFTDSAVQVRVKRAQALVPTVWLWRCLREPNLKQPQPFLRADGWELQFPSGNKTEGRQEGSTYTNAVAAVDSIGLVRRWLPMAVLANGKIGLGSTNLEIPSLTWNQGKLSGTIAWPQPHQEARFNAVLGNALPYTLQIQSDSLELRSSIRISAEAGGLTLYTTNWWRTNQIDLDAQFARNGFLPEKANLKASPFNIPAELLGLPEYQEMRGTMEASWVKGEFGLNLQADAVPLRSETNLPAAHLDLRARGDTNAATIESAILTSPWLRAELSREMKVYFTGPLLREPGKVKLAADLGRQPWIALHGTLDGEADLSPAAGKFPEAKFHLTGTNVGDLQLEAETFAIRGEFRWPVLNLQKATATFDDGSRADLNGSFDWAAKAISGGHLDFIGPLAARWLPAGYGYENLALTADFSGPLDKLAHQGCLMLTNCFTPQTKVLQVTINWTGEQAEVGRAGVVISSGEGSLEAVLSGKVLAPRTSRSDGEKARPRPGPLPQERGLASSDKVEDRVKLPGSFAQERESYSLGLQSLTLKREGKPVLELEKEARILVDMISTNQWKGGIHDFHWRGTGGDVAVQAEVEWPRTGSMRVTVTNAHSDLFDSFLKEPLEPFEVRNLAGMAGWTNGPIVFAVELGARNQESRTNSQKPIANSQESEVRKEWEGISAEIKLGGDGSGMWITNLAIISRTSNVAVARGFLPVTLNPGNPTDFVQLDTKNSIDFKLSTEPNSIFWQKLAERTGVILTEPNLQADVTGTWAAPRGRIQIRALKIELPKTKSRLPALEHLELDVVLDRQEAVLTNFNLLVQGQPVNATAQIPLGDAFWTDLKAKKIPSWEKATGHLAIKDAQIAAFAKLFPALLSPQGEFSLDVSLTPGANLAGELSLSHGRTRPLPNIGPIRDITMGMMFSGRTVKLKSSTIAIGGSTVVIAGEGDLSGTDWLKGVPPPFEFVLLGTNVPLSHQPESIIRSDLNLAIRKTNGAPPLISGTARLRNSYFFSDLADLVPGRVSTAERRPPYFSIEEPGLADWRLAIHVTGERGLKVRTTLFTGQVTPNVRVEGTLKEPLAIGDVKIESGTVKFPFADLEVQQGFVMLASDDPYRPRLLITAASRKFGYDVKMEMSGPADQPIIQFSSTPPLSSDQLILMVTAGQLPRGGYNLNPQQRAQTMALFLGKDLLSKLGFGDQSEERLSFSSGQDISETGKPTYSLEYKLTDRWSLVGEYDRFNAFNAGVKWKLYSK